MHEGVEEGGASFKDGVHVGTGVGGASVNGGVDAGAGVSVGELEGGTMTGSHCTEQSFPRPIQVAVAVVASGVVSWPFSLALPHCASLMSVLASVLNPVGGVTILCCCVGVSYSSVLPLTSSVSSNRGKFSCNGETARLCNAAGLLPPSINPHMYKRKISPQQSEDRLERSLFVYTFESKNHSRQRTRDLIPTCPLSHSDVIAQPCVVPRSKSIREGNAQL